MLTTPPQVEAPQVPPSPIAGRQYPALDGLRGVAILAVFASHFGGGHKSANPLVHVWSVMADAGWMGVDLFFCLSGFLITGILYDTASKAHRIKNFYARRALRIFPIFYGVLFGLLLLTPVLHLRWQAGHLFYFFYLSNMLPVFLPHLPSPGPNIGLTHLWSLAVEEQFYLLWPFVIWSVRDRSMLMRIAAALAIGAVLLRIALVMHGTNPFIIYSLLFTRADSLLCGALLALMMRGQAPPRPPMRWLLPISGAAVISLFLITGSGLHDSPLILSIGFSIIAVFSTCLVYCACQQDNWLVGAANNPVLRFFGRYSYGLYVYHGLLVVLLFPLLGSFQRRAPSAPLGDVAFLLGALTLSLVLAVISYHLIESPILRLKKRFA